LNNIRSLKILIFLFLFVSLLSRCSEDNHSRKDAIELSSPSKMKDIVSLFVRGYGSDQRNKNADINEAEIRSFVNDYYGALRWQRIMSVSSYISDTFFSTRYGDKRAYLKYFKDEQEKTRVIKLTHTINDIFLYGKEALVCTKVSGLKIYLKSSLIEKFEDEVFIWINESGSGLKIEKIVFSGKWPHSTVQGEEYRDLWMFYTLKLPKDYVFIKAQAPKLAEYIYFPHKTRPASMYLSVLWVEGGILSPMKLIEQEEELFSKETDFKLIKKNLYARKGYDAASMKFSYSKKDETVHEYRTYFLRWPLLYVVGAYGDTEHVGAITKDYEQLLDSFVYLNPPGEFHKNLHMPFEVSGISIKNNLYKYFMSPPIEWKVAGYKNGVVQFKPVRKGKDDITYIYARKKCSNETLGELSDLNDKIMGLTFKRYKVVSKNEISFNGLKAYRVSSKFKRNMLGAYRYKEQLFVAKNGMIYEMAMTDSAGDETWLNDEFPKFISGFHLN